MENKLAKYGVNKPVSRPKIKPIKQLNLDSPEGKRLVYAEARIILAQHKKTFERLASM
ncbi:acetyltransferase [Pseudidiomarina homiensis]|uniref:acetyltransferase n=1 Tax=Pseudidiomarina homiensis TaxID=364198 RepID=UPI00215AB046|nr:acetyltransferase [Pseudidiomarina homiensis]